VAATAKEVALAMSSSVLDKDAKLNWMGHLLGSQTGFKLAYRLPAGDVLDAAMSAQVLLVQAARGLRAARARPPVSVTLSKAARARRTQRAAARPAVLMSLVARARAVLRAGAWSAQTQLLMTARLANLVAVSVVLDAMADAAAAAIRAVPARADVSSSWLMAAVGRVEARARAAVDVSATAAARAARAVYALLPLAASLSYVAAALRVRLVRSSVVLVMSVAAKPYFLYWHLHRHVRRTVGWPLRAMRRRI
jgi:hypothetical protein